MLFPTKNSKPKFTDIKALLQKGPKPAPHPLKPSQNSSNILFTRSTPRTQIIGKQEFDSPAASFAMLNKNKMIRDLILKKMDIQKQQALTRCINVNMYKRVNLLRRTIQTRVTSNDSQQNFEEVASPVTLNSPKGKHSVHGKLKLKLDGVLKQIGSKTLTCKPMFLKKNELKGPLGRSNASCILIGDKAYLFGGISNHLHEELYQFNFSTNTWKRLEYTNPANMMKPRFAHSCVQFQNKFVIYGGEEKYNVFSK